MNRSLPYLSLMGATIDSLVEEIHRTGQQVSMTINYGSKETHFLFSQTLESGPTIEANYTYKRGLSPIHGLTCIFTAYYHLIRVVEQMSTKDGTC